MVQIRHDGVKMTDDVNMNGNDIMGFPVYIRQRTGVTVNGNLAFSSTTRANLPLNTLRAAPFLVPQNCTLDRIGVRVIAAGGAGANIRVGVYSDNGNLYPNALLVDGGELDATGTGILLATVSVNLAPGIYWLVGNSDDNQIDWDCVNTAPMLSLVDSIASGGGGWTVASAYAALPASFPVGAVTDYNVPMPYYRIFAWL